MSSTSVLVIDDDTGMRAMMAAMAQSMGLEALMAEGGAAALALYEKHRPAVVVTDIFMPEMDGFETIENLRAIDPDVKVVAISGGGALQDTQTLRMAQYMGAHAILEKPFRRDEFVAAVSALLAQG